MDFIIFFISASVVIFILTYIYSKVLSTKIKDNKLEKSNEDSDVNNILMANSFDFNEKGKLVDHLLYYHSNAKNVSVVMLLLSILSLLIGSVFFYYASDVAMNDKERKEREKREQIEDIVIKKLKDSIALKDGFNLVTYENIAKSREVLSGNNGTIIPSAVSEARNKIDNFERNIKVKYGLDIRNMTNQIFLNESLKEKDADNFSSLYILLTTISIRIIIAFLTFFFGQLFLKLYNYQMRISDFYLSRLNAIKAFNELDFKLNFKEAVSMFEHNYNIEYSPKIPLNSFVEIIKGIRSK